LIAINSSSKGKKIIPLFSRTADIGYLDTRAIKSYFDQQGTPDMIFPFFCTDPKINRQRSGGCYLLILPPKQADLTTIFQENIGNAVTIIFFSEPITDLTVIENIRHPVLLKETGQFDFSFSEVATNYVDWEEFETERSLWRKRALLYQDFIMLSKMVQQKEYYDIIDWYHKEYESLPGWYKRCGHLLKVITGKRTFRSLFRNDVKKYKD